ncbi:unnamed protein product [Brugia timori]|uniref:CULT domain-containing protein n=1 Tax=Brugia timori TaxID=42155 RepID=A0A0R3QW04_9BILA|nr:unnamed protein product [Brugia timori]
MKLQSGFMGPTALSYWVAANLPIDMEMRLRLLDEPYTDRRLKDEYGIINRIDVIVCKNCSTLLCNMSQMISVSTDGNSAHYVNPGGYVHDLFTVSEVVSTLARGTPSAECSWFPGYKWTIHECSHCGQHVGWRFTSSDLSPKSFFGLTRRSIRPADSRRPITFTIQLTIRRNFNRICGKIRATYLQFPIEHVSIIDFPVASNVHVLVICNVNLLYHRDGRSEGRVRKEFVRSNEEDIEDIF